MSHPVSLDSVLAPIPDLAGSRSPDYQAETRTLVWLAEGLARQPREIFRRLAEAVMKLTPSQSAGISLLDGDRFVWPAVAGDWEPFTWGGMPRGASPCGSVLERDQSLLFIQPHRHFAALAGVSPPIAECLLVPFRFDGKVVGTIWAILHDGRLRYDGEDARLLTDLSEFTSAAYRTLLDAGALEFSKTTANLPV